MKYNRFILLVAICMCFVTKSFSQKGNYRISNGFSIGGGVTNFNIITDNFITKEGNGFAGGFAATVDIPHRWYNVSFGMQLSESSISISGRPDNSITSEEFIDYKMFAAQVALMAHIKIIETYFTLDVGPMLQYNGKLELKDQTKEVYFINNYSNLSALDITNISQFNLNGAIGVTAGIKFLKLKAQYVYGFTNILKKLENENLDTTGGDSRFKGNQTMLVLGASITF
jgi:hypothetical protein